MKKILVCCIFVVLVLAVIACGLRFVDIDEKKCSDCVDFINLQEESGKIQLGDKVLEAKVELTNSGEKLIIGDKVVDVSTSIEFNFDKLYVFKNEMILVTATGEILPRTNLNYFYDKNLNPLDINLVLDKDYPNSMLQTYSTDLDVKDNRLIIKGSRLKEELVLVGEDNNNIKLCVSSGNPTDYTKEHTDELLEARYEAKYLGNYKFSDFKKVEDIRVLNEEVCYYD